MLITNHFEYLLDLTIPKMTVLGISIPHIKLFGTHVQVDMKIHDWTKFNLTVDFDICIMDESINIHFNMDLDAMDFLKIPAKIITEFGK